MKHTQQSLLALAATRAGKHRIRAMVYDLAYGDKPPSVREMNVERFTSAYTPGKLTPLYHSSLDAMGGAEDTLTRDELSEYSEFLKRVTLCVARPSCCAKALYRAVAFILTKQGDVA